MKVLWNLRDGVNRPVRGRTIKIGTRASNLALAQAEIVIRKLRSSHPHLNFVAVPIRTTGDRIASAAELRRAGKGLFVKEIERALLARKIRMAVHSLKDLPTELPPGLTLGAVLEREDPRDAFIGRTGIPIEKLPHGALLGTSSLRRQAILKAAYPHLAFTDLRGNLDTRLEKLRRPNSPLVGIVVAVAGLRRLHAANGIPAQILPLDTIVPAAGQGALGVEIRENDEEIRQLLAPIHHPPTAACIEAERELLRRLEGGCQVPLGACAEPLDEGLIRLNACLASPDGQRVIRGSQTGIQEDPRAVAEALETILNSRGAQEILASLRFHQPRKAVRSRGPSRGQAPSRRHRTLSRAGPRR